MPEASTSASGTLPPKIEPSTPPTLPSDDEVRDRSVVFCILALSEMVTITVRMSPILWARWSLKKPRASFENSEFGWYEATTGSGIGICTGR